MAQQDIANDVAIMDGESQQRARWVVVCGAGRRYTIRQPILVNMREACDPAEEPDRNLIFIDACLQIGGGPQFVEHGGFLALDAPGLTAKFFAILTRHVGRTVRRTLLRDPLRLTATQFDSHLTADDAALPWADFGQQAGGPGFQRY